MYLPKCAVRTALLSLAVYGLSLCAPLPVSAATGKQFVALRHKFHCNRTLSYAIVVANPASYIGRVIELRGTVGGIAETDQGLTVMLNQPDLNAPILDIPRTEAGPMRDSLTPQIRVLVRVGAASTGNTVPLTVLAVVNETEVLPLDQAEEARARAREQQAERQRQEREQWEQQVARSTPRDIHAESSRGGISRSTHGVSGNVYAQAAIYEPALNVRVRPCFVPYFNFIARHNTRLDNRTVGQITYHLLRYAEATDIDPRLVVAMIVAESDFDPASTSHAGAMGLGQLMPDEARQLGLNNPYDVQQNLYGAVVCLKQHLNRFADPTAPGGTITFDQIRLALAAYNAGPGAVRKYKGIPPYRETQAYVRRIEKLYRQLCGE